MNNTKRSFLTSLTALLLCISMLIGTTFAWFTDTVTSKNNIILAGNIDAEMYWSNELLAEDSTEWLDASQGAIFNHQKWEPGYTEVKYVKVVNNGSLNFKWKLGVEAEGPLGLLADVIDVYYVPNVATKLTNLNGLSSNGSLVDVLANNTSIEGGSLQPGKSAIVAIAFHMDEEAGNDYQGKSVCDAGFSVKLVATQEIGEFDSFGDDYDKDSTWPIAPVVGNSASASATAGTDGRLTQEVTMTSADGVIGATIPAGVKLEQGTNSLKLTISNVDESKANITLNETEATLSIDVHVEGVSEDNDVVMEILVKELLPVGLNMGNHRFYHVEDGATVEMNLLANGATPVHNNYEYDPATGDVVLYLKSFSEVALVADTVNAWEGKFDYSWYTNAVAPIDGESVTEYIIANADQLAAFGAIVGGMVGQTRDSFSGKTVKLVSDINLGDKESENKPNIIFYPIGYYNSEGTYERTNTAITSGLRNFEGTFDGNGHTIANFYQNTWEMKGDHDWYSPEEQYYRDGMGLFGRVYGGTVKNLTVKNFSSDGEITTTGTIAAYADCGATFENIAIFNCNPRVYNIGNGGIVGCVGWYSKTGITEESTLEEIDALKVKFKNITVDNSNKISALWGSYDVACGGIVGQYYPTSGQTSAGTPKNAGISFENCHVSAVMDVYNDVCANYQYYAYRYTGMMIGSIRENETIDGHVYPKMDGITASGCTVHFGDWNDYYYCELVANTTASYTHDHQMSRLTQVAEVNVETKKYRPLGEEKWLDIPSGRVNYVVVKSKDSNGMWIHGDGSDYATCYHFVDGAVWNHENAGYHDGKNGEKYIDENGDGVADLKEDKQLVYREFNQLFTGYGWGVTSKGIEDFKDTIILDKVYNGASIDKFEKNEALSGDFLYRVGNVNEFSVGKLFKAIDENLVVDSGVYVSVESLVEGVTMVSTFKNNALDWKQSTLHITGGTGPAKLTIKDYNNCKEFSIIVEVVDAKNITSASGSDSVDVVLLGDVNAGNYVNYTNCTVYGNGFTYSLNGAPTEYNSKQGHGIIITKNATLDNLVIVGDVYNSYGAYTNQDCYNSAVDVLGETTIQNCYISGCAAPVLTRANATITNTTLYGGTIANLLIKSGVISLKDVTTANYDDGRELVGMGIVIHTDANDSTKLILNGTLTQYNFISERKIPSDSNAKILYNAMFDDSCAKYHFGISPERYVNAGVISMTSVFDSEDITDNANTGYIGSDVRVNNKDGYVYTQLNNSGSVNNNYIKDTDTHVSKTQGAVAPKYSFDFTNKNYQAKQDGSNDYCYQENSIVYISMDEGDTFNWDTSILKVNKLNQSIDYTVSMNGVDYTGKSISFTTAGYYAVTYTYTDNNNYCFDSEGNIAKYSETYEKTVYIQVLTVKSAWKDAEINVNKVAMSGIYVMSGDYDYSYKMKFLDCVTITDYDEAANSLTVDLSKNIKSVSFVDKNGANPGKFDANSGTITITYNDGKILTVSIGAWSGSGPSTKTCSVKTDDGVYLITDGASNAANTGVTWKITGYSYTGNNGALVNNNTTVTFTWDTNSEGYNSKSECITPDTLITLADGTQVRVDSLTGNEELLVWNMETGKFDKAPIMFLDSDAEAEYEVIKLYFSDGTEVKVIYEHGFWDYDLNKYVYLDKYAHNYIGHTFAKQNGDKLEKVTLVDVVIENEITTAWSPVTVGHLCYFVNGMLSMPGGVGGLFNIFEVNPETMTYDYEQLEKDIETYGLFTYEELNAICPLSEDMFYAAGGAYLKISIGKGNLTMDELIYMINRYSEFFN